ncbi:hypothetical protein JZ751_014565 [Albula glossodonta]|uniref:Fe2OG dioxygenase domain-containing protein n=1 Tax=Albula glossodonta TaxID=121402 RepID=A0A8T2N7I3_9TELE|nr:hypothetical protein JZ751_014565 [Albula glossodonta]
MAEIPDFLSEEECRVVVQLAQLKGLTESQAVGPGSQEETADLLELTPEEMFNLLDLNQDGQLQLQEVLANSRTWDGMWLTPESLQGIYAGLQADPDRSASLIKILMWGTPPLHKPLTPLSIRTPQTSTYPLTPPPWRPSAIVLARWPAEARFRRGKSAQTAGHAPSRQMSLEEFKHLSNRELWHLPMQPGGRRPQGVRNSRHTWLYQGEGAHHVLRALRKRVTRLTQLPPLLVDLSEPMQVVRYEQGGHHHSHHDSGPFHHKAACSHTRLAARVSSLTETFCRYITVLFYLNSVEEGGETTFPVADNRTYNEEALIQENVDLLDTRKSCDKGNLRVKPTQGTAIFWYNHLSDGKGWVGDLDEYSLHGDCVLTRGTKWIANNWINIDPDYQRQARYQKLVSPQREDCGDSGERNPDQHTGLHQDL